MKKTTLFLFCVLTVSLNTSFALDYISCTENADQKYVQNEGKIKDSYEEEVSSLETSKAVAMRDNFTIFKLRSSLHKMQELRTMYKAKLVDAEIHYKSDLNLLRENHKSDLDLCSLDKKEMQDGKETEIIK